MDRREFSTPHWKGDENVLETTAYNCYGTHNVEARVLSIIWGNDSRFWQWIQFSQEESRSIGFKEGVVLNQVNWIEVKGKLPTNKLFKVVPYTKTYGIYYVIKFQVDSFGWHLVPIKFKVFINGKEKVTSLLLEPYRQKQGVWHEVYGGEFANFELDGGGGEVVFGMFETESNWWKGGLVLGGVRIKPKPVV